MAQIKKRVTSCGEYRYDVRWRLEDGGVRTRSFKTRREANAYATTVESDRLRGIVIDPRLASTAFDQVAERWLESNPRKRESTKARDRSILKTHILPVIGRRSVGRVTRAEMQALVDNWSSSASPRTVTRQYAVLRAVFRYTEDTELIARTPCRGIRLCSPGRTERPTLEPKDLERLATALGTGQATMMWTGAVLGLRWAEAAGMSVGQLDMLSGRLRVDRQLSRNGNLTSPKSEAGIRTFAVPRWLLDEFASVLAGRGLTATDPEAFVFVTEGGAPLHYSNWRIRTWLPACQVAGIPRLKFHDLRALSATVHVASGADVKTTQTRLGHSSARVTLDLYARATEDADRRTAEEVGAWFRRPRDGRAMEGSVACSSQGQDAV